MTSGEKRFARLLESHLEDDYLCWFEPRVGIGARSRYTDFIILHPARGLLLLEIKDWKLSTLHEVNKQTFTLLTDKGLVNKQHPLEQARQCTYHAINKLCNDPALQQSDGPYKGSFVCPYAFGVVLTAITRAEFNQHDLGEVLPEHLVICKDEMKSTVDPEALQSLMWGMFPVTFQNQLTLPQIDRVRWHLFPEIRISEPAQIELLLPETENSINEVAENIHSADIFPDIVRVMDSAQEKLARSMGEGHRIIHGVAGSGKTLILGYRCLHLAGTIEKPILVLCFNVTLAAKLRELIANNQLEQRVHVRHFHDWCGEQLRTYHIDKPKAGNDYIKNLVATVIKAAESEQIPRAQYGAIMIDEGHDFEPDWLRLVVSMIDPKSDSLLLLYDDAQAIYSKRSLDFSLSSVGIQARGRTTVLRVNYRNTNEILSFAYRFASKWMGHETDDVNDDEVPLLEPESAGRRGPEPIVRIKDSYDKEADFVARCIMKQHDNGTPWSDMCVTYRAKWMGDILANALKKVGAPVHWLKSTNEKSKLSSNDESVKLMTMHSSKGLEYPFVVVSGVGTMPYPKSSEEDIAADAKLLYVAMTRSTDRLLVTAHKKSDFVNRLVA